eukprot:CAMPEP_0198204264 /NCGR_PEP_ID=MMETSP1445-20131203/7674_1 /TAXON_ID=36898 /ORGANISM="Pyramimonas sp., Strain CCMP2087" /LENGTH=176 /DNA_ID=CAMNT_0043876067 /DNA_START=114 /DNA_END=644 /DNA_ORIENTATION=-
MTDEVAENTGIWAVMGYSERDPSVLKVQSIHATFEEATIAGRLHQSSYLDRDCEEMVFYEPETSYEGAGVEGRESCTVTNVIEILPIKDIKCMKFLRVALKARGTEPIGTRAQLQERLQRLLDQTEEVQVEGGGGEGLAFKRQMSLLNHETDVTGSIDSHSELTPKRRRVEQFFCR